MIKESIQQEGTNPNVYASHNRVSKYMKQELTELKGETDNSPIIVDDFNTPVSSMDWTRKKKNNQQSHRRHAQHY